MVLQHCVAQDFYTVTKGNPDVFYTVFFSMTGPARGSLVRVGTTFHSKKDLDELNHRGPTESG